MVTVKICIGSSCYLKGSKDIIASLERLVELHGIKDKVNLTGSFCLGHCVEGVCVLVNEERFSVSPATVESFFNESILKQI